jgi:hypothetical protein
MNSTAAPRDLHVADPCGAKLLLLVSRAAEDRMRMRIDETWRENAATAVDTLGAGKLARELALGGDCSNEVVFNRDTDAGENSRILHFGAAPRSRRPGTRYDLRSIDEEQLRHANGAAITSRTRDSLMGACASPRHA